MKRTTLFLASLSLAASLSFAEAPSRPAEQERGNRPERGERPGPALRPMREPMTEHLFAPELLRRFAEQLNLADDQKAALKAEMDKSRSQLEGKQQQVHQQVEALGALLKAAKIDEAAAAAQLEKVLSAESEVKKEHLLLLIRVKNLLTPEQQAKLAELRKNLPQRPAPSRPGHDGPRHGQRPHDGPPPPPKD